MSAELSADESLHDVEHRHRGGGEHLFFAGFILPHDPVIKSIGLAFAIGILIDAFLIRMTLIPALMTLLGERAWWMPRWLDRFLPNLDLEGAALPAAA